MALFVIHRKHCNRSLGIVITAIIIMEFGVLGIYISYAGERLLVDTDMEHSIKKYI